MRSDNIEQPPVEEPLAELERQLLDANLAGAGCDFHDLITLDDDDAHRLLAEASLYPSERLSKIDARAHYLNKLLGRE